MDTGIDSHTSSGLLTATNSTACLDGSNTSSKFSIENFVGMFLTLGLCLLTQPYGSLLYRPLGDKNSSKSRRRVFFLWRLNPLACVGEAVVIGYSLQRMMRSGWEKGNGIRTVKFSRNYPFISRESEGDFRWKKHLHVNAAALLMLRANDDGELKKLFSACFLDEDIHPATLPRESSATATATGHDSEQSSQPQPGVIRRRTTLAEACIGTENLDDENLRLLRKALGSNVLAHEEKWVDLVTAFSVIAITVKLAVTTLPWNMYVPAVFMLAGWFFVWLLLYLFHLEEVEESAMIPIVKEAQQHEADMGNRWVIIAITYRLLGILLCSHRRLRTLL